MLKPIWGYLPYRAALNAEYRIYSDTWGIGAQSFKLGYVHPFDERLTLETNIRAYKQNEADFYSDLFPYQNAQNFLARDKELSAFNSNSIGIGVSYDLLLNNTVIDKVSLNLFYNYFKFSYDNFRDIRVASTVGEEPLYELDAHVIRAFVSFWF